MSVSYRQMALLNNTIHNSTIALKLTDFLICSIWLPLHFFFTLVYQTKNLLEIHIVYCYEEVFYVYTSSFFIDLSKRSCMRSSQPCNGNFSILKLKQYLTVVNFYNTKGLENITVMNFWENIYLTHNANKCTFLLFKLKHIIWTANSLWKNAVNLFDLNILLY